MKISVLKTTERVETRNDKSIGIQAYGEKNDYPQKVMEVIKASCTGKSCVNIYAKFIAGRGFANEAIWKEEVNSNGYTTDYILQQLAKDLAYFGGFALHVNYNALFEITSLSHVPFENIRFEALDENGRFDRVALHPDWGRRNLKLRTWKKEDIRFVDLFDPTPSVVQRQVDLAGGWGDYNGQILYYSNEGDKVYPTPIYDQVVTDMSTEEGCANIKYRNARNGFQIAGIIVDYNNTDKSDEQRQETQNSLKEFQTDENSGKILYVQAESKENTPSFIPLKLSNYDKDFEITEKTCSQNIGRAFNQPPILRAEDVGANFGADLMRNAYNFYNSITENERYVIEREFSRIFPLWHNAGLRSITDYSLTPCNYDSAPTYNDIPPEILKYLSVNECRELIGFPEIKTDANEQTLLAEKLGVGGTQAIIDLLADPSIPIWQKEGTAEVLFGFTDDQIQKVFKSENHAD